MDNFVQCQSHTYYPGLLINQYPKVLFGFSKKGNESGYLLRHYVTIKCITAR